MPPLGARRQVVSLRVVRRPGAASIEWRAEGASPLAACHWSGFGSPMHEAACWQFLRRGKKHRHN
eukprot:3881617-Pyramimonas_sp.AAC.1